MKSTREVEREKQTQDTSEQADRRWSRGTSLLSSAVVVSVSLSSATSPVAVKPPLRRRCSCSLLWPNWKRGSDSLLFVSVLYESSSSSSSSLDTYSDSTRPDAVRCKSGVRRLSRLWRLRSAARGGGVWARSSAHGLVCGTTNSALRRARRRVERVAAGCSVPSCSMPSCSDDERRARTGERLAERDGVARDECEPRDEPDTRASGLSAASSLGTRGLASMRAAAVSCCEPSLRRLCARVQTPCQSFLSPLSTLFLFAYLGNDADMNKHEQFLTKKRKKKISLFFFQSFIHTYHRIKY